MGRDTLAKEDVRARIQGLTTPDHLRLKAASRYLTLGSRQEPADLLNEAILRSLDGVRQCPSDIPIVLFLINVMRSILFSERQQAKLLPRMESLGAPDSEAGVTCTIPSRDRNQEELLLAEEDSAARLQALDDLFKDDDEARLVVMGDLEGMPAQEIQEMMKISAGAYATVRRRMRRKIDAHFPKGWPA